MQWLLLLSAVIPTMAQMYTPSEDGYRLYSITYATDISRNDFCTVMEGAWGWGYKVNVIGYEENEYAKYKLVDKVFALRKWLKKLPKRGRNVILFMDAYDVLVNAKPMDLLERFLDMERGVVFAAERGCCSTKWHMMHRRNTCDPDWPIDIMNYTTPWINTGVFIGFQSELEVLLDEAWIEYQQTKRELRGDQVDPYLSGSDQQLIGQLFAHGNGLRDDIGMALDLHSDMFKCMYQVQYEDTVDLVFHEQRVAFKGSAYTYPVVVHFNGPKHVKTKMMEYFYDRASHPQKIDDFPIANSTFLEVCVG